MVRGPGAPGSVVGIGLQNRVLDRQQIELDAWVYLQSPQVLGELGQHQPGGDVGAVNGASRRAGTAVSFAGLEGRRWVVTS